MVSIITITVIVSFLIAGLRYPGALLAGTFATYQAGALLNFPQLVIIYTAVAGAVIMIQFVAGHNRSHFALIDGATFLLLLLCTASQLWSLDTDKSAPLLLQLVLSIGGMYLIGRFQTGDPLRLMQQMCLFLAISGAVLGFCLLANRATGSWTAQHRLILEGSDAAAVGLSQSWPAMLLACVILLFNGRSLSQLVGLVCLPIIGYVAIIAATRSVFLAFAVGAIVYIVSSLSMRNAPRLLFGVITTVAAGFSAVFVMPAEQFALAFGRFDDLFSSSDGGVADASARERFDLFTTTWSLLRDHPFGGIGYGAFGHFAKQDYPHNLFLEILVSLGATGFAAFIIWLLVLLLSQVTLLLREQAASAIILAMTMMTLTQLQVSFAFSMAKPLFLMVALTACFLPRGYAGTVRPPRVPKDKEDAILQVVER
jgi:O-antigen ligase